MCGDGANGHRRFDRYRCRESRGGRRADRTWPRRNRRLHQGREIRVPTHSDLHADDPYQQMRDAHRARRGADYHRARGSDTAFASAFDDHQRLRDDGAHGGPGAAVSLPECLARAKPYARRGSPRFFQASLSGSGARRRLVLATP